MAGIWSLLKVYEEWLKRRTLQFTLRRHIHTSTIFTAVSVSSSSAKALLLKTTTGDWSAHRKRDWGTRRHWKQVWQTRLGKEGSFSQVGLLPQFCISNRNRLDSFSNSNAKFIEIWQLQSECWRSNLLNRAPAAWNHGCFSQSPKFASRYFLTQYFLLKRGDGKCQFLES